ncbi:MAG TPA: cyclophilin-like family protein [Conexivisphaerales archaeon]|nr:cyclophilin-like family protein [Conexivisphaerales archaeon]
METTPPESFSRVPLHISVLGKGDLKGEIIKHLAPSTTSLMIRRGKVSGRVTLEQSSVVILTNIKAGPEKPKTKFAAGDIGFLPLNGALYIFLSEAVPPRPMNHVGRVTSGERLLKRIERGDTIVFEAVEKAVPSPPK